MKSVNNWSEAEVNRAESTWGYKTPQYTLDMFNFLTYGPTSWLDLGCGFGRFLDYLLPSSYEADYIGYDSSSAMIQRISERFPHYSSRIFLHKITDPINVNQQAILCSAVLIHITLEDQDKVLNNIKQANPLKAAFDINSPGENWLKRPENHHFERFIKGAEGAFRMTWQSHYDFTWKILNLFPNYHLTTKYYDLKQSRNKVIYLLERR